MQLVDLTGQRFGSLTVVGIAGHKGKKVLWHCICDCGTEKDVAGSNLKSGHTKTCGRSLHRTRLDPQEKATNKRLRSILSGMIDRCENENSPIYEYYGGKGITVCEQWRDFNEFKSWALRNGYSYELTIERIDNGKGYEPSNCTWATRKQQANNRATNLMFTYGGKTQNLTRWCEELGLDYKLIHCRIRQHGWSFERAITEKKHYECSSNAPHRHQRRRVEGHSRSSG